MAVEAKRGCGYRQVGGTYLVGGGIGVPCDRLPLPLTVCPCCSAGIKPALGWTWVDVGLLIQGPHKVPSKHVFNETATGPANVLCHEAQRQVCTFCAAPELMGKAGLIWIGEQFYKTPAEFVAEGVTLGFSRRIAAVPRNFKVGETWVLLAHRKAIQTVEAIPPHPGQLDIPSTETVFKPGVFYVWRPERIEQICLESARGSEEVAALEKRGIHPVFVPDGDKDHQRKGGKDEDAAPEAEPLFDKEKS